MSESKVFNMDEHYSWGDTIKFFDWQMRKITGCKSNPKIKIGDILTTRMDSGRLAAFKVVEIKYMNDPKDQFFGTVEDKEYLT